MERLTTIPGVGQITALTWILEIGDPHRFSSIKKAVSYCGLCSDQKESGGKQYRGPISKKRNKRLQTILIEAAKLAPLWNPQLREVYEPEKGLYDPVKRDIPIVCLEAGRFYPNLSL